MKVAVVILNWNTKDYLKRFLPGLLASCRKFHTEERDAHVVVADNASTDGSLEMLKQKFPRVKTISLDRNYGFTGGYNRALARIKADYYVLINSDVKVSEDWLSPLAGWMQKNPDCGVCGPKLHALVDNRRTPRFEYAGAAGGYVDLFGYPFCRGRILSRTEPDYGQYDKAADVLWVSGACMMVRSSLWRKLGGFDERFFAHMEEIDFCWRAQSAGWKVNVVPQSIVWHLGGGTLPSSSPFKLELNFRNNLLMLAGNLPDSLGSRMIFATRYALDWLSAAAYALTGRFRYAAAVFKAHAGYRRLRKGRPAFAGKDVPGHRKTCILIRRRYEDSH